MHVDPDFFDGVYAFGFEDLFGADAIRANGRRVHLD
jgi:hypothetical protein